jgi:hypothetical protein
MSRKWWLALPAFLCEIARWAVALVGCAIAIHQEVDLLSFRERYNTVFYAILISAAVVSHDYSLIAMRRLMRLIRLMYGIRLPSVGISGPIDPPLQSTFILRSHYKCLLTHS